jgi:glycosyltransferase involved in cell wall biosynthesis
VATYTFPDAFGGAERYIHDLARAQAAAGHDITVLTGNVSSRPVEERHQGFRFVRYPLAPLRGLRFSLDVHGRVTAALRELAAERFDVLHAHQIASALPALGGSFPARKVLGFHASHQLEFEAEHLEGAPADESRPLGLRDRAKSMAIAVLDRRCLRRAERIVVLSNFVLGQVTALVPGAHARVRVIPAGVDLARFHPGDREPGRRRLGLAADEALVVCVRRLVRRMGIDILLRAAARVAGGGPRFVLAIGGAGPERAELESLARELRITDRVRFLGRIPDEELPDLLRAADLVVVPSRSMEGFGMFTVEGLACGTPVLATASGGSPEILGPVDPMLLVAPEPEAMADRIESLLRDPALRRDLGERAAESVRARFTWERAVARMDEVYGELAETDTRSARGAAPAKSSS